MRCMVSKLAALGLKIFSSKNWTVHPPKFLSVFGLKIYRDICSAQLPVWPISPWPSSCQFARKNLLFRTLLILRYFVVNQCSVHGCDAKSSSELRLKNAEPSFEIASIGNTLKHVICLWIPRFCAYQ